MVEAYISMMWHRGLLKRLRTQSRPALLNDCSCMY